MKWGQREGQLLKGSKLISLSEAGGKREIGGKTFDVCVGKYRMNIGVKQNKLVTREITAHKSGGKKER